MSLLVVQIVYFAAVLINILIFTPICCYYTYKFWQLRDDPLLSKRYPMLTIYIIIAVLIHSTILRTIGDLPDIIPSINYGPFAYHIRLLVYNAAHVYFALGIYRIWLLFYDYTRGLHLISRQWQSHLLNNDQDSYWTLKYTFLSPRSSALFWVCFVWVVFVEICLIFSALLRIVNIVQPLFLSTIVVLIIALAFKVKSCRDEYFFYAEQKRIGVICTFYIIAQVFFVQIFDDSKQELAIYLCSMIVSTAGILVLTKWVIIQLKTRNMLEQIQHSNCVDGIEFKDILTNTHAFDYFALHLVSEYSLENLLFLYESMKLKSECLNSGLLEMEDIGLYLEFAEPQAMSPTSRVRTMTAFNAMDMESFHNTFRVLVNKYLVETSEYAVNVSYDTRAMLLALVNASNDNNTFLTPSMNCVPSSSNHRSSDVIGRMDTNNEKEVVLTYFGLLDNAIQEVEVLIACDSFYRFAQTATFRKIFKK
eukprot:25675_1